MSARERLVQLRVAGKECEGLLTWDDERKAPAPTVLVFPTIRGRTDFEDNKARRLAALGYTGLAVDLYGVESRDSSIAEFREYMNALRADRVELQQHLLAWVKIARQQDVVSAPQVAAIGFCFGGLCVLDLARTGADIAGVVSFHGIFDPPSNTADNRIKASVLVLHGWDDPLAPPAAVQALAAELTSMGADWQIHAYGNTLHAFTNPAASDKQAGTVYDEAADRRSWLAMKNFLAELFF